MVAPVLVPAVSDSILMLTAALALVLMLTLAA
jgi:hypothetical protein